MHMHWPTEDASTLIYRKGESRCILVASGLGPRAHMYAHLKPCDSKQASGLLTVAAAAAPPPPPGAQTPHFYDPVRAPPPPPGLKRAALEVYVRKVVKPRVVAICEGGIEGHAHQTLCMAIAESLGKYQPIVGYGMVAPFCERVCWHSCNGESHAGGQARQTPAQPIAPFRAHTCTAFRRRTTASWSARARAARRTRASTSCCGANVPLGPPSQHQPLRSPPLTRALSCAGSARPCCTRTSRTSTTPNVP